MRRPPNARFRDNALRATSAQHARSTALTEFPGAGVWWDRRSQPKHRSAGLGQGSRSL